MSWKEIFQKYLVAALNWLFTKDEARALACISVINLLILCKAYNLYDVFFKKGFLYELEMLVYYQWSFIRGLNYLWKKYRCPQFCISIGNFFFTINWNFGGLAFNELTLNRFKTIRMLWSNQFSTTERFGLDLYKVPSSAKLQSPVFSINIMRSLTKILNMRGSRIEPWRSQFKYLSICL